mmetsp:Transcript_7550/g.18337  ORF Transcript_7550/g.18337 Transcript_7550/m.18337 type:complete len:505 (-) Transcript_7550:7-1521(-)
MARGRTTSRRRCFCTRGGPSCPTGQTTLGSFCMVSPKGTENACIQTAAFTPGSSTRVHGTGKGSTAQGPTPRGGWTTRFAPTTGSGRRVTGTGSVSRPLSLLGRGSRPLPSSIGTTSRSPSPSFARGSTRNGSTAPTPTPLRATGRRTWPPLRPRLSLWFRWLCRNTWSSRWERVSSSTVENGTDSARRWALVCSRGTTAPCSRGNGSRTSPTAPGGRSIRTGAATLDSSETGRGTARAGTLRETASPTLGSGETASGTGRGWRHWRGTASCSGRPSWSTTKIKWSTSKPTTPARPKTGWTAWTRPSAMPPALQARRTRRPTSNTSRATRKRHRRMWAGSTTACAWDPASCCTKTEGSTSESGSTTLWTDTGRKRTRTAASTRESFARACGMGAGGTTTSRWAGSTRGTGSRVCGTARDGSACTCRWRLGSSYASSSSSMRGIPRSAGGSCRTRTTCLSQGRTRLSSVRSSRRRPSWRAIRTCWIKFFVDQVPSDSTLMGSVNI